MIRVKVANGILIEKNALGLLKRHTVLAFVFPALGVIPFETYACHTYIVFFPEEKSSDFPGEGFQASGFMLKRKLRSGFDGERSNLFPLSPGPVL
jgi:hypothetical protein